MADFVLLMDGDTTAPEGAAAWGAYLAKLRAAAVFKGGSAIGAVTCVREQGVPATHLTGVLRIAAGDLAHA
jgi:hypothetical protein